MPVACASRAPGPPKRHPGHGMEVGCVHPSDLTCGEASHMGLTWRNQRLNTALFTSIALHVLIAMMIPALVVLNGEDTSIQTITFARLIPTRITTPRPIEHPVAAVAPVAAPATRIVKHKPAPSQSNVRMPTQTNKGAVSQAPLVAANSQSGSASERSGTAAAEATPQAQNSTDVTHREPGGYMPLGAEQPVPVLDPAVRDQLKQMNVHVTLVITVG